jgi:hypothetical protein
MRVARRAMRNDPVGLCRHGAGRCRLARCDSSAYVRFPTAGVRLTIN